MQKLEIQDYFPQFKSPSELIHPSQQLDHIISQITTLSQSIQQSRSKYTNSQQPHASHLKTHDNDFLAEFSRRNQNFNQIIQLIDSLMNNQISCECVDRDGQYSQSIARNKLEDDKKNNSGNDCSFNISISIHNTNSSEENKYIYTTEFIERDLPETIHLLSQFQTLMLLSDSRSENL